MAEIVSKSGDVPFKDLHPTKTAGKGFKGLDLPPWGGSDGRESKFVRCKQCGFLLNREKNPTGSGWGNIEQEIYPLTAFDGLTPFDDPLTLFDGNYGNTIGNAGCPLCGASAYE
jgi:hypothetical protein